MKGWKTIIFNIISLILLIVNYIQGTPDFIKVDPVILGVIATVGNFILRFITDTPVFSNVSDPTRAGPDVR